MTQPIDLTADQARHALAVLAQVNTEGNRRRILNYISQSASRIADLEAQVAAKTAAVMACNDEAVAKMAALKAEVERLRTFAEGVKKMVPDRSIFGIAVRSALTGGNDHG